MDGPRHDGGHAECNTLPQMRKLLVVIGLLSTSCGPPAPLPNYPEQRAAEPARDAAYGEVLGVDHVPPSDALASGVRLRIGGAGEGPVVVDLAPDWYLDRQGLRFAPKERVEVEGRRSAENVIYATRVTKGDRTVELRDAEGRPLWKSAPAEK
jgi:hypothetical protein